MDRRDGRITGAKEGRGRMIRLPTAALHAVCLILLSLFGPAQASPPLVPPTGLKAVDHPWDGGEGIDLSWDLSTADRADGQPQRVSHYKVLRSEAKDGPFHELSVAVPDARAYVHRRLELTVDPCRQDVDYFFRVVAVSPDGSLSTHTEAGPVRATRQPLNRDRLSIGIITVILCGAVVYWIHRARRGGELKVRTIAGLEAVNEAVGRATEMGRSCLFIPGTQDMNDIQTIAGITVLARVAQTAAEYDATIEVPTSRSLVMTTARETVQASFLAAGRPEAYREDLINYVTDEQFGYVAHLTGMMVRTKPAACFYMGAFFAESLILAETGNSIGAIQVAGTAQPAQLPFFVAACDFTLIGEEFFAASAYLSGKPEQLGSLKGQDVGKVLVGFLIVVGCTIATAASVTGIPVWDRALVFLQETVLK